MEKTKSYKILDTIRDGVRDLRTHAELCATKFFEENDYNLDTVIARLFYLQTNSNLFTEVLLLKIDADCKCNKGLLSELESTYTQLTLEVIFKCVRCIFQFLSNVYNAVSHQRLTA